MRAQSRTLPGDMSAPNQLLYWVNLPPISIQREAYLAACRWHSTSVAPPRAAAIPMTVRYRPAGVQRKVDTALRSMFSWSSHKPKHSHTYRVCSQAHDMSVRAVVICTSIVACLFQSWLVSGSTYMTLATQIKTLYCNRGRILN
jgi:hypothetical protein